MQTELQAAVAAVTAAGEPYEARTENIRGVDFTVFANAPANLRTLYESGLAHADNDFYVYQDERYTYRDMWRRAAQCANRLGERGIVPGDRVGVALRNYPEWIAAFMGITSMGAVAVAVNAWWSGEELVYGIEDSGLKILFTDIERTERVRPHLDRLAIEVVTVRHAQAGLTTWEDFTAGASVEMPTPDIAPDDDATILYTSGSTAHPKGVLSTHRAITNALLGWECGGAIAMAMNPALAAAVGRSAPAPEHPPAVILTVPLFHVTGLVVQTLSSFRRGRKLVGMYKWDAEEALRIIEAERITEFNGVPTMAWELVQSPNRDKYDLSSLKSAGGGGAPMAPEHARQIDKTIAKGAPGTGWGMTETQGLATTIGGEAFLNRPRSCGRAVPPIVKVKAVAEDGRDCAPMETGELWIWGVMNFSEYWNKPDATAESLTDGWVHTGDVGHVDEEGLCIHHRPPQGHGAARRREHRLPGGGGGTVRPSERAGGRGIRRARRASGRNPGGGRGRQARHRADRRRRAGFRSRTRRQVQGAGPRLDPAPSACRASHRRRSSSAGCATKRSNY